MLLQWFQPGQLDMIKKLVKHGNSLALVIDRGVLDLLKIDADTPLELKTDGSIIIVAPVRDAEQSQRVRKSLAKMDGKYGPVFKRLAD